MLLNIAMALVLTRDNALPVTVDLIAFSIEVVPEVAARKSTLARTLSFHRLLAAGAIADVIRPLFAIRRIAP
jgi:hypothetical protein